MSNGFGPFDDSFGPKDSIGARYPEHATKTGGSFGRCEPFLGADLFISRFMKGIPLITPGTKEKFSKKEIEDFIRRGASDLELEATIDVYPVERTQKLSFDRALYVNWIHLELSWKPLKTIIALEIVPANQEPIYKVPSEWIELYNAARASINVVPLISTFSGLPSVQGGPAQGAAIFAFFSQLSFVPAFWRVIYISGFDEGLVPVIINELIGINAAIKFLSLLASLNKANAASLSIDGLSQSTSTPGPQVYDKRIEDLEADKKKLLGKVKNLAGQKIKVLNV